MYTLGFRAWSRWVPGMGLTPAGELCRRHRCCSAGPTAGRTSLPWSEEHHVGPAPPPSRSQEQSPAKTHHQKRRFAGAGARKPEIPRRGLSGMSILAINRKEIQMFKMWAHRLQ